MEVVDDQVGQPNRQINNTRLALLGRENNDKDVVTFENGEFQKARCCLF